MTLDWNGCGCLGPIYHASHSWLREDIYKIYRLEYNINSYWMGENVNSSIAHTELICKPPTHTPNGWLPPENYGVHFLNGKLFSLSFSTVLLLFLLQMICFHSAICPPKDLAFLWLEVILDNTKVAIYYGIHFKQWLVQLLCKGRAMVGHTYVFPLEVYQTCLKWIP